MSIKIEEVDSGHTHIEWEADVRCGVGQTEKTFQLDYFYPTCLKISCEYKTVIESISPGNWQPIIWMSLTLNIESSSKDGGDGAKENHHQPRDCWISVNGNEKIQLKESPVSKEWKSEKFAVNYEHPNPQSLSNGFHSYIDISGRQIPLTCLIWIKFKIFNLGEKNALNQFTELFVQQTNCDVHFCFENGQRIGAHVLILSTRSSVFSAMFQRDSMLEQKTSKVDIQDFQSEIFKELLHYIYSGRTRIPLTEESAQPLFVAADKYNIEDLRDECVGFLLTCFRVDNVINLMTWAHLHSVDKLKEAAFTFAAENGQEVSLLDDWEMLVKNHPEVAVIVTRRMLASLSTDIEKIRSTLNGSHP